MSKKILITALVFIFLLTTVTAITGSIGNSRMVLRLDPNEEIEKYILVKNINDVPLTIFLTVNGDLADNVEIKDEEFVLQPQTEKKAYFTIKAGESGTSETKINVKFVPEEGNGVGLTSTIIIIVNDDSVIDSDDEDITEDAQTDAGNEQDAQDDVSSGLTGRAADLKSKLKLSISAVLITTTIVLILVFLALIIYYSKLNGRKEARRVHA